MQVHSNTSPSYVGRFAPSPSGQLHFGSLVTALASYLDARHHMGKWLVRMEDIDEPRCIAGVDSDILRTLECHGLHWDEQVIYQRKSHARYQHKLDNLLANGLAYYCGCTRKQVKASGGHHDHACRNLQLTPSSASKNNGLAVRLMLNAPLNTFDDNILGHIGTSGETDILGNTDAVNTENKDKALNVNAEDVVIKRSDGLFSYHFVVALDDEHQNITHVVRGSDLLAVTPYQHCIYHALNCHIPHYAHIPVASVSKGRKLSKQNHAAPINNQNAFTNIINCLAFLGQDLSYAAQTDGVDQLLLVAISRWNRELVPKVAEIIVGKHESTYYNDSL